MPVSKNLYDSMKIQYENFVNENVEIKTAIRYITELNFIKKLLEIAEQNALDDELAYLNEKKATVIQELSKFGIKPKNI